MNPIATSSARTPGEGNDGGYFTLFPYPHWVGPWTPHTLPAAMKDLYEAYYQPINYGWEDVRESIRLARKRGVYTALNLLTFPGVTDQEGEAEKLCELVARERVDQVQARSLAIDPDQYLAVASQHSAGGPRIGLRELLRRLRKARRGLVIGNFARGLNERRV